ncbi:MAG TPA: RNA methyltransferase [Acidiferrobacterales bacterium]|nr:RNA methyltransferase [Acidiferrobacterales bacterium]
MTLNRIRIVLVQPSHGGNIGGCARAMKNMGLTRLVLVAPEEFPSEEASARAAGADDVLAQAQVCATLDEAIADCHLVIGASARERRIAWPRLAPDEAARKIVAAAGQEVAVLFGRERTGLTNDELDRCQILVNIPANPEFSSLNLACAVQLIAYEIRCAAVTDDAATPANAAEMLGEPLATSAEIQRFYQHLDQVMVESGFLDPNNPRLLTRRIRRLFNRVELTSNEVNILRGILSAVTQPAAKTKS